jgi:hypothetical protein
LARFFRDCLARIIVQYVADGRSGQAALSRYIVAGQTLFACHQSYPDIME